MKSYRAFQPFRLDDGSIVEAGQVVKLEEDVARLHAGRVELIVDAPASTAAAPVTSVDHLV